MNRPDPALFAAMQEVLREHVGAVGTPENFILEEIDQIISMLDMTLEAAKRTKGAVQGTIGKDDKLPGISGTEPMLKHLPRILETLDGLHTELSRSFLAYAAAYVPRDYPNAKTYESVFIGGRGEIVKEQLREAIVERAVAKKVPH